MIFILSALIGIVGGSGPLVISRPLLGMLIVADWLLVGVTSSQFDPVALVISLVGFNLGLFATALPALFRSVVHTDPNRG